MEKNRLPALIKKINRKKILLPVIFLCIAIFFFTATPIHHILSIKTANTPQEAALMYHNGDIYLRVSLDDLYYTGVNRMQDSNIHACYYYCIYNDNCYYVLISADELKISQNDNTPPAYIEKYRCTARLEQNPVELEELTKSVSRSLHWTTQALNLMSSKVLINQHSMTHGKEQIYLTVLILTAVFAFGHLVFVLISLINPARSLTVMRLSRYGKTNELFQAACDEYEKAVFFTPDIALTDNFIITYDSHSIHIVPLVVIIWAYKFATMRGMFFHPTISYSLSIVANDRKHFIVHRKSKESVDLALGALQTRFPEILIGYTEGRKIDKKY